MDCVLQSFAHCLNLQKQHIIDKLGHDGSQIINGLDPPACYRGFSIFELTVFALNMGYASVHIPKYNYTMNGQMDKPIVYDDVDMVKPLLNSNRYCLYNNSHMIGVRWNIVHDALGNIRHIKDIPKFDYQGIILIKRILM